MKNNYEILGLSDGAPLEEVERKYGALLRQYKRRVDNRGATYEDLEYYQTITSAYNEITGKNRPVGDTNPSSIIPFKIRDRFEKIMAHVSHYSFLIFAVLITSVLIITFLYQTKDNKNIDLGIKFVGAFSTQNQIQLNEEITNKSEVTKKPVISFFTVTTDSVITPSIKAEAESFLAQLWVGTYLDIILIDKESYDVYLKQGAFYRLDDIAKDLNLDSTKLLEYKKKNQEELEDGIYGIDITDYNFFDGMSLEWLYDQEKGQEKIMILTIARTSKNKDKAIEFLKEIINS